MCGVPTTATGRGHSGASGGGGSNTGWIVAGVISIALVVAVGSRFLGQAPPPTNPQVVPPQTAAAPAPDISQMTPRERADRLFERIMMADARGLSDTVAFFTPMALQAYAMLGETDIDAHYHIGLIQALAGNSEALRAHADSIRGQVPTHLMATMLDFALYRLMGDSTGLRAAYEEFKNNYQAETDQARPEYNAHSNALDAFLEDAGRLDETRESGGI